MELPVAADIMASRLCSGVGVSPIGVLESQTCSLELSAVYFQPASSIFLSQQIS
jgi:hypothetical protein